MRKFLLLIPLLVVMSGCGSGEQSNLISWMKQEEGKMKPKIAPIPTLQSEEEVGFKTSEFEPFGSTSVEDMYLLDRDTRKKEVLEMYPLDSLKMVGSYKKNKKNYALVKATDGVVYIVAVGNKMGENYGVITVITEDVITVKEKIKSGDGNFTDEITEKTLEPDEAKKDVKKKN